MTTRADGRGGSTPPRPAAPDSPAGQWFRFGPWVYDVDAAFAAARRAATPAAEPSHGLGTRLRADPRPRQQPARDLPDRPRPGFDPGYAMTTSLDDPLIIATLTTADGQSAGPLLIDGCHRLHKAAVTSCAELPSSVLTAAETLSIRHEITLDPGRWAARTETRR